MFIANRAIRTRLAEYANTLVAEGTDEVKAAAQKWLDTMDDIDANSAASDEYREVLAKANLSGAAKEAAEKTLADADYLAKKAVWIFGGDGWAYDIGFGGLDHVLAQGEDVNVLVFDTEVYSNTGGQASKINSDRRHRSVCRFR